MDEAEMARTESAFREVNEAIANAASKFQAEETDFVCECADPDCAHRMTVELEDYEDVRTEPTQFLRQADGEILRHDHAPDAALAQDRADHVGKTGHADARFA